MFFTLFEDVSYFFLNSSQLSVVGYICYICFVFFLCICIVYVRYTFWEDLLLFFFFNTQILSTSVTSLWMIFLFNSLVYVRYTFFKMYLLFLGSSQLYVLVYICYIYFCGFPMYLHCIHLLRIF